MNNVDYVRHKKKTQWKVKYKAVEFLCPIHFFAMIEGIKKDVYHLQSF